MVEPTDIKGGGSPKRKGYRRAALLTLAATIVIILGVNLLSQYFFTRIDATDEKLYTLSDSTKYKLRHLQDGIYVKVFLSGDFPAGFKHLQTSTREMLDEMRVYAGSKLQYSFVDPLEGKTEAAKADILEQMRKRGMKPTSLRINEESYTEKMIFPYAEISLGNGQTTVVRLLENQVITGGQEPLNKSISLLEYKFMYGIRRLMRQSRVKVGFTVGNGEPGGYALYDMANELVKDFELDTIHLDEINTLKKHEKLLIIGKPAIAFSEKEKYILDQFLMNGGRVLWLIDGTTASMDSLHRQNNFIATANDLNLNDQLFRYGCRINSDLVMDLRANQLPLINPSGQINIFPWFYFPIVTPDGTHPIVRNLDDIGFQFTSSIDTIRVPGVKKTVLLHSSKYSRELSTPWMVGYDILKHLPPNPAEFTKRNIPLAVLLEGQFTSLYKSRVSGNMSMVMDTLHLPFKEISDNNKMIVIASGSLITNGYDGRNTFPLGYFRYRNKNDFIIFDNKDFLLNCIEYLTDDGGLINTRTKTVKMRLLDKTYISDNRTQIQIINVGLPIVMVILGGFIYVFVRRRRYVR